MAAEIPTHEPRVLVASTTWEWDKTLADFPPSDGWQLSYFLRSLASIGEDLDIDWGDEVNANGETFEVRVPFGSTKITPGAWDLFGEVTDGTKKHLVFQRRVKVLPGPSVVGTKSHAVLLLEALEAVDLASATRGDKVRITVNGRTTEFDHAEYNMRLVRARLAVEHERNPHARLRHAAHFVDAR